MKTWRARLVSIRDLFATAWPIILVTALGFVVAYQFVEPAPPKRLTISTGGEQGAYHAYARRYAELLAQNGITLEILTSEGSQQNLERLRKGEADVAFVQGGIEERLDDDEESALRSLGSVSYEPVWVFYRSENRIDKLFQLAGARIAVGEEGSGIRGLALQMLEANAITADSAKLLPVAGVEAVQALQQGRIDAAFIIATQEALVVQQLLHTPAVRVMSFVQADAYVRRFPFLSKVVLPRAVVDLISDTPPRDTMLLATTANLIVRDDVHPALVSLLLQAMTEVNGKSGFFQRAGEFPAYRDRSFVVSGDAARYYKSGPPLLQRYLPFWIAVLVERLFVLILPVIILLLPLLRLAPSIYSWRVRSKIYRSYGDLKFLENELRHRYERSRHAEYSARLDRIEEDAYSRNIPLSFSDLFYTLREHINLVRAELLALERRNGVGS